MTLNIPIWSIPVALLIVVWLVIFLWPIKNDGGRDYGAGVFITGMIRIVVGLICTVVILFTWIIFK